MHITTASRPIAATDRHKSFKRVREEGAVGLCERRFLTFGLQRRNMSGFRAGQRKRERERVREADCDH